jgi:hypothetical protein
MYALSILNDIGQQQTIILFFQSIQQHNHFVQLLSTFQNIQFVNEKIKSIEYLKYIVGTSYNSYINFECEDLQLSIGNIDWIDSSNPISCGQHKMINQFNIINVNKQTNWFHGSKALPDNTVPGIKKN